MSIILNAAPLSFDRDTINIGYLPDEGKEAYAMRVALEAWAPGQDPAVVAHALREAQLVDPDIVGLGVVLERVARQLDASSRARVVSDLRRVSEADGRVTRNERDLVGLVERALGGAS